MIKIIHNDGSENELNQYLVFGFDKTPGPDNTRQFVSCHETQSYSDAMMIFSIAVNKFCQLQNLQINDFLLTLGLGVNKIRRLEIQELEEDLFSNTPKNNG